MTPRRARPGPDIQENGDTVPKVRTMALAGFVAALVLLGILTLTAGLRIPAIAAGLTYAVVLAVCVGRARSDDGGSAIGPADVVTLTRAVLVAGVTALVVESLGRPVSVPLLVALSATALVLDAVDGAVARRTRTASSFGARFDMEIDAFLILVLSVSVARSYGAWVLAIGAARYALWVAGRLWPWLTATVPPRYWRKVVAAVQGIVLTVVLAGILPQAVNTALLVGAAVLLAESFGRDVWWLWRHRPLQRPRPALSRRSATRRVAATVASLAAFLLVWIALAAPDGPDHLSTQRVPAHPGGGPRPHRGGADGPASVGTRDRAGNWRPARRADPAQGP